MTTATSKLDIVAEPGSHAIRMTRAFNAPRALVFKAFTDPKLIPQWWGPGSLTTTVDKLEAKAAGAWRFVQHDAEGNEYAFHGVFHDVNEPEQITYTFEWEGLPGHVLLETITFDEKDGVTTLTDVSVFQSVEDRDGMIENGMEGGAQESMDRLAELLTGM